MGRALELAAAGQGPAQSWWADDPSFNTLSISAYQFRPFTLVIPWFPWSDWPKEELRPASLYNDETLLRIVKRSGRFIAVHRDKRDDDMSPIDGLPKLTTLILRNGPASSWSTRIMVTLNPAVLVPTPPAVEKVFFWWETANTAAVAFAPPAGVAPNVFRVVMAAFDTNGSVVPLLDFTIDDFALDPATGTFGTGGLLRMRTPVRCARTQRPPGWNSRERVFGSKT